MGQQDPAKDTYGIRDLGREFRVSARTLRFYEEKGLISPRREGQDRLYSRRDRARLQYVLMGKSVGFSLDEIREMLDFHDAGERQGANLRAALHKFEERIGRLQQQKSDIDRALAELGHAHKRLEGMIATRERRRA